MKKVLITGANSYVGNSFKLWAIDNYASEIHVDAVGTRNREWEGYSFEGYDTVMHVAGIAHVSTDESMEEDRKSVV